MTRKATSLWVPVIALTAVVAAGAWLVTQDDSGLGNWDGRGSMMDNGSMMGNGSMMSSGSGPVGGLADARDRVEDFAETVGGDLRVGEVMRFTKNYYAELEERDGTKLTEVLVDPQNGAGRLLRSGWLTVAV